jgi:GAF domain-containing protein
MAAPRHPEEARRLAALRAHQILDTPRDPQFDRLTFLTAQILKVPIAAIGFVDADRVWLKARVGLDYDTIDRDDMFSAFAILQSDVFVIEDARSDARFDQLKVVAGPPFIRFYAGAPLFSADRLPLGTLSALDRSPRRLALEQLNILNVLAREAEELLQRSRRGARGGENSCAAS